MSLRRTRGCIGAAGSWTPTQAYRTLGHDESKFAGADLKSGRASKKSGGTIIQPGRDQA
jgi:hypothetical protein